MHHWWLIPEEHLLSTAEAWGKLRLDPFLIHGEHHTQFSLNYKSLCMFHWFSTVGWLPFYHSLPLHNLFIDMIYDICEHSCISPEKLK